MSNNKTKLTHFKVKLGSLLEQKKVLLSKVVSHEFDKFCLAVQKVTSGDGTNAYVRDTVLDLERVLKKEGLFKYVKSGFLALKKEFLLAPGVPGKVRPSEEDLVSSVMEEDQLGAPTTDTGRTFSPSDSDSEIPGPSISHLQATKENLETTDRSKTAVVAKPPQTNYEKETQHLTENEDIQHLNKAVGRLFDHLKIHKHESISIGDVTQLRHRSKSDDFQDLVSKIQEFEEEFHKQKVSQHTELIRLMEENRSLKSAMHDMKKENNRLKCIQPIASKAANRQVEKIEEQFKTQRKGMAGKIQAIEVELQSNLQRTMHEKDVLEQVILDGVGKLKVSIINLHRRMVKGTTASDKIREEDSGSCIESLEELGRVRMDELLKDLADIEVEAKQLQKRNEDLRRQMKLKDADIRKLKTSLLEITSEVTRMYGSVTSNLPNDSKTSTKHQFNKSSFASQSEMSFVSPSDVEMSVSRSSFPQGFVADDANEEDVVIDKLKQIHVTIQQYKRLLQDQQRQTPKDELQSLKSQINKIHDDLMSTMRPGSVAATRTESIISGTSHLNLTGRTKTGEVNQLLQKLIRVEKACTDLLETWRHAERRYGDVFDCDDI